MINSQIIFTDWATNQPDNSGSCLQLFGERKGAFAREWFKFDDNDCKNKRKFICEKNLGK